MVNQHPKLILSQLDPSCTELARQADALQASEIFPPLKWSEPWRVHAATIGNAVVGVANVVLKPDGIIIDTMCVGATHRNRGIGSALMNHVTSIATTGGYTQARVTPLNYINERLYRRLGFDYPPGHYLTMCKQLS